MNEAKYKRLPIEEFGRALIRSKDLDPVYVMLNEAGLSLAHLSTFCLAYWCFYHVGVAAYMAERGATDNNEFWSLMWTACVNERGTAPHDPAERWPRAPERRHFRGQACEVAYRHLKQYQKSPYGLVNELKSFKTFREVYRYMQSIPQFGPWISFKVADMLQNVLAHPLDSAGADLSIYAEPVEGARMACKEWGSEAEKANEVVALAVRYLSNDLQNERVYDHRAGSRPLGIFEYETILCKWKSHMRGHYSIGKDSREIHEALTGWGDLAESLKKWVPLYV